MRALKVAMVYWMSSSEGGSGRGSFSDMGKVIINKDYKFITHIFPINIL